LNAVDPSRIAEGFLRGIPMNVLKSSLIVAFLLAVSGCSNMPWAALSEDDQQSKDVAVLTDYKLDNGFITIEAVGYGCTFFNSFAVELADRESNALEVVRIHPDNCGMKPRNVSLQYSFKHLGLDLDKTVRVKNPINDKGLESLVKN
jgi:hypothetical protein